MNEQISNDNNRSITSENKNVYILDASAALYMVPIDRYNKNYDMFNVSQKSGSYIF